ncbi:DUF6578 domain-containing protein [Streptomyces sp. Q6]|uniref:DUF6578 domain-containing protein n=1 Tax=Streptomyces citrinus TaxID=3118173 RepID=A0ACD5A9Q3_9ACTN
MAPAAGRVRSVRILTRGYAPVSPDSTTYQPVPGERWLRTVDACPKWFGAEGRTRRDDGALVVLDVPGDGSSHERGE